MLDGEHRQFPSGSTNPGLLTFTMLLHTHVITYTYIHISMFLGLFICVWTNEKNVELHDTVFKIIL